MRLKSPKGNPVLCTASLRAEAKPSQLKLFGSSQLELKAQYTSLDTEFLVRGKTKFGVNFGLQKRGTRGKFGVRKSLVVIMMTTKHGFSLKSGFRW